MAADPSRPGSSSAGRPRTRGTDEAIVRATLELLAEVGIEGTTMGAVAERAGVARATVYLRWPTRDALLAAATREALGRPLYPLTGDFDADLRRGVHRARNALAQPLFLTIFPEVARALLARSPQMRYDEIAPNRRGLAEEYGAVAEREGFRDDIDATAAFDLVVGATLNHLLATGEPPTEEQADRIADIVLAGLRSRFPAS